LAAFLQKFYFIIFTIIRLLFLQKIKNKKKIEWHSHVHASRGLSSSFSVG